MTAQERSAKETILQWLESNSEDPDDLVSALKDAGLISEPGPQVSTCKCPEGDIRLTWPDGKTRDYIRTPQGHQHGAKTIDAPSHGALAETIWRVSRADEGTISATGANIVATTVLRVFWGV